MVAAALSKDIQTRKVRASQGRMPDNGGGNSKESATEMYRQVTGKGGKAV